MEIINWLTKNKEWVFSGVGLLFIPYVINFFKSKKSLTKNNDNSFEESQEQVIHNKTLPEYKNETKILFIDDKVFPVTKILENAGWIHTKRIKDCKSLDMLAITEADILFIDIQGVGKEMNFHDEGLGLALAIKERYRDKKVVIYSAETQGDRFHKALNQVDKSLAKNSDSYEFQKLVEEFTIGEN